MSKWIKICDDTYEGCNIRTRGMVVPGGMVVQTISTIQDRMYNRRISVSTVFVPDAKGISGNQGAWLVTQEEPEEPTGNTH